MFHRNSSAITKDFFTACVNSSTSLIAEYAAEVLYDATRHSLLPAVNPLLGFSSGKPVQDQLA